MTICQIIKRLLFYRTECPWTPCPLTRTILVKDRIAENVKLPDHSLFHLLVSSLTSQIFHRPKFRNKVLNRVRSDRYTSISSLNLKDLEVQE